MGNGIAHVFAMNNYSVNIVDVSESALQKAMATIEKNLDRMLTKGTIDAAKKESTLHNLKIHTTLAMVHTYPDGDRDFSFYRNPGADMMLNKTEISEDILKETEMQISKKL